MADGKGVDEVLAVNRSLEESRGYFANSFNWLAEQDPGFEAAHQALVQHIFAPRDPEYALPLKYRELVFAGVLAHMKYPTCEWHLRAAIRAGATVRQAIEAMETAAMAGGFPTLHYSLPFLIELAESHGVEGNE